MMMLPKSEISMRDAFRSSQGTVIFSEASVALARCRTQSQLVACVEETMARLGTYSEFDLIWLASSTERSLRRHPTSLPEPQTATRLLLADGQIVVEADITFVPLVARGLLQGWIVGRGEEIPDSSITSFAAHCASALVAVDPFSTSREPDRERAMLDTVAEALSSTLDLDLLLGRVATSVEELIDARGLYVALVDQEARELSFAYLHLATGAPNPGARWSLDEGLTGVVVRTGEPLVTDDYLEECRHRAIAPQGPATLGYARAWLGVPLRHHDQTLGVLVVTHDAPGVRFEAADVRLLSTVAAQAAAAIANAQLYARVERQASQLALINKIGQTIASTLDPQTVPRLLVNELTEALDVSEAIVYQRDPDDGILRVRFAQPDRDRAETAPVPAGIAYDALQRGTIVIANASTAADHDGLASQAVLCAPLSGRRFRGVIELRSKPAGHFRATDVAFVQAVAEQATIALENAQLYGQTDEALRVQLSDVEERNRQLAEMITIGYSLRATLSVQQLADLLGKAIHALTDSPRVVVGLIDREHDRLRLATAIGSQEGRGHTRWLPLGELTSWLGSAEMVGTTTYHVGPNSWLPNFDNAYCVAIHDSRGTLVGAVILDSSIGIRPLTPDLSQTIEIVANQAGIALTNAALYAEQQMTVDRLTALNALSLSLSTQQLSDTEIINMAIAGAIGTTGGQGGGAIIVVEGLAAARYTTGLTTDIDPEWLSGLVPEGGDYLELGEHQVPATLAVQGIQRMLVIPLRGANLTVGTLWIGYAQPIGDKAERETAVLYAKMTGAVLENLYLAGAVRTAHDRMASILMSTREGMLLIGEDLQVTISNRAFADLLSVSQAQLQSRPIRDVLSADVFETVPPDVLNQIGTAVEQAAGGDAAIAEGKLTPTTELERHLTWHVLPVRAAAGLSAGALLVVRDVTADHQMERLRQDLANMIVHDLRSPLTNMLVSVDLLLKPATGPLNERQNRILNIASASCHQMLDLINALLDIRRLEKRKVELETRPTYVADVATGVIEVLERIAEEKVIRVEIDLDGLPPVEADPEMIRRVIQNLVDNALKFSPSEATVRITAIGAQFTRIPDDHPRGDWIVVEVQDQGAGVPIEYQKLIFELFVQAPEGHGHGTGIGLAFCKLAVEAHGGRIWVESVPGEGATFRFTLPVATKTS